MNTIRKSHIVGDLLAKTYGKHFSAIQSYTNDDETKGWLEVIFTNKPGQKVKLLFIGIDTWDKIKNKVQKLIDSDGICVVCCEKEKGKKKLVKRPCEGCDCGHTETVLEIEGHTHICYSCCEYICKDCVHKNKDWKCMVCRQCINKYYHIMEDEVCDHD